ncbi:MAG: ABC transporter ATP-binding protein [Cyanobacteria bacterium P01_D01_bin.44]
MRQYFSKVLYILSGKRQHLILLLAVFVFVSVLEAAGIGLIGPFLSIVGDPSIVRDHPFFGPLVNRFGLETDRAILISSAILIICVFCFKSLAYFLGKFYTLKFSYRQKQELEARLMDTYLNIPYAFHLNQNSATLIKNLTFESGQFTVNCLIPLLDIVSNGIVMLLLLGLLAAADIYMVITVLAILLPVFLIFTRLSRRIRSWGRRKSQAHGGMIRSVGHGLGSIKETRILGCESYFEADLRHHSKEYGQAATLVESLQLVPRVSIETVLIIFLILFILLSNLVLGRSLEELTSIMGIFAVSSLRMIPAATRILNAVGRIRSMSYAIDMLYRDLKTIEAYSANGPSAYLKQVGHRPRLPVKFDHEVVLDNLTFHYPNSNKPAIEGVSLKIRRGESIALVGKSGSGKTTLVDIILGLLEPSSGDICVDGVSVYQNLRSWQNLLGYIPQSIFLTDETVAQNIAFGIPLHEIDPDRLNAVIKAAQLEELIEQLPQGIHTSVGERGVRLSGGQRQRIGIARALYYGREILVLDEATSALDTETEKLVSDAIDSLVGSKTLIIIAHRFSTIANCDRVYRLENGQIQQTGTYEEVILTPSN